jgi:hypothetical protein
VKRFAILGAAALVLAVALYFVFHTTDKDPAPPPAPPDPPPAANVREHEATPAPSLPAGQGRITPPEGSATAYTIDGIEIRDHRGSNAGPKVDLPPNIHPPETHMIPSTLTHVVSKQMQAVLAECARSLPPDARGPKPRLEGEVIVAIKSGKLTVTKAMTQFRDVVGDPEVARSCVEQKTVGISADASDQPDIDNYSIHVSFAVLPTGP